MFLRPMDAASYADKLCREEEQAISDLTIRMERARKDGDLDRYEAYGRCLGKCIRRIERIRDAYGV